MKTLAELLASGSLQELASALQVKSQRFEELVKLGNARESKLNTQEETTEMTTLDSEMDQIHAKHIEVKKVEDAKQRNADRVKAFATPANPLPFPGKSDDKDPSRKTYLSQYSSVGSLKHINFSPNRAENEEQAYRFFKWFCAVGLKPDSPLRIAGLKYCEDNGIPAQKALSEGVNEQGGALVPPEFDNMLIRLIERFGLFRGFTRVVNMASEVRTRPRRTGGVTAVWVGEGKAITASNQAYDNVNLVAKKLAALTVMSSEIGEDSAINIADEIAFEIGYAMALAEDQAGFNGDATSTYGGITGITQKLKGLDGTIANIAGLFVGTAGSGASFNSLVLADFNNTVALLPQYADGAGAAWYCHRSFYFAVMQRLETAAGGVTFREIAQGDRAARPLFLGYPVNFTQVMPRVPALSTIYALLGDISLGSMMGDRRNRTLFTDPYSLAANDQIQVRGTERIDIVVHDVGNASATAALRQPGPIVGLISPAS